MLLLLKDTPVLRIEENGTCKVLDFDRLPFGLRKEKVTFVDFIEWASNRTLSIGRSFAKEVLNSLRLSQNNRYEVCRACRGLSLEDCYWIRQEEDTACWKDVNLFHNELALFVTEVSLSGQNINFRREPEKPEKIHTPELTTLGASAKGWIRGKDGIFLHKVGKYEIPAAQILQALQIPHISYAVSSDQEIDAYLSRERKEWLEGAGEKIVHSRLFTSEQISLVTFEEFASFCGYYRLNPYEQAERIDRRFYLQMQIADYLLNNSDRHEQNWGFFMDNQSGQLISFCPLFDHDRAFSGYENLMSQTTEMPVSLFEAARRAQQECRMEWSCLFEMEAPDYLTQKQWEQVLARAGRLCA